MDNLVRTSERGDVSMRYKCFLSVLMVLLLSVSLVAYLVRPGDVLLVSVYGSAELSGEIVVGPDGTAALPPLGSISVLGKSLDELQSLLSSRYVSGGILAARPQVTVSVRSFAPYMFYVLGEVNKPGAVEYKRESMVASQLIALAGGLKDGADLTSAFVIKSDGSREPIDLSTLLYGGPAASIVLKDGSTLFIPAGARAWIRTIGEFRSQSLVRFSPGLTLTQIIAHSGGLSERADSSEIVVLSDDIPNGKLVIDMNAILAGTRSDPEIPAGSIVVANDSSKKSVKLLGEIRSPSSIAYRDGLTLLQAIGEAGGIGQNASGDLFILRSGVVEPISIAISSLLKGELKDPVLNPGDTVFIPRESERFVYIASSSFGGKVQFSIDERMTLANALVRADLYDPSRSGIVIVDPSGKSIETDGRTERLLETGSMIILPQGDKSVYVVGEVVSPGQVKFGNFDDITLGVALARAGGYTERAAKVEIVGIGGKQSLDLEEAATSSMKVPAQSIIFIERLDERFVYVVSSASGGRVDFSEDESFTLKSLLAKLNLLKFNMRKEIEVIDASGVSRSFSASEIREGDFDLKTGSIIVVPDITAWVYTFGEFGRPGKVEIEPEDLFLTRAISSSGGYTDQADISSIEILSSKGSIRVDLQDILKGKIDDVPIEYDDLIYIPRIDSRFVYVVSKTRGGKVEFASGEAMSLRNALAKLNLVDLSSKKTVTIVSPTGSASEVPLKALEERDYQLDSGTVIFYPDPYNTAFVLGHVRNPGSISLEPGVPFTLSSVLAAAGGLTDLGDKQMITVLSTGEASLSVFSLDEIALKSIELRDGDTVYVPQRESKYVYIVGGVRNPGVKTIERSEEDPTITKIVAMSGGLTDPSAKVVEVINNQERKKYDLQRILAGTTLDQVVDSGSVIYIPETTGRFVYIVSKTRGGRIDFDSSEELTLRTALAKENLLDVSSDARLTIIFPDGTRRERLISELRDSDIPLQNGSIILYPITQKQLYIMGGVRSPGSVVFESSDKVSLTTLIARAGGITEQALTNRVQITDPFGRTSTIDIEPILLGRAVDIKLEDGASVFVPIYEPIRVNVLGEVRNPGQVEFSRSEIPGLLLAISKAGGLTARASSEIRVAGTESDVNWYRLLEGVDLPLKNGQTIYVPNEDRYVYVSGEVNSPGRYDFSADEEFTLVKLMARAGGVRETASDEIKIITPAGEILSIKLAEVMSGKSDVLLRSGSTVLFPKQVVRITILGSVRNPGVYVFNRGEPSSISDAVARAGGLIAIESVNKIAVQIGGSYSEFDATVIAKRTDNLTDDTFIYVSTIREISVTVLGEVLKPGRFKFEGNRQVTVAEAIAIAGGLDRTVNTLSIVSREGNVRLLDALKTEELARDYLRDGDTVVAIRNFDAYVSVIGDVKQPGIFPITQYGEISLAELLTLSGGINSFDFRRTLQIMSGGKSESIEVEPKDLLALSRRTVSPGSIVFVPHVSSPRVYVFGEVLRPGVIKYVSGMTAIEAIVEAGGPTSYAVLGNTLLFQSSGEEPLVVNLDQQKGMPVKGNIQLLPGNIIYIPQSPIVNIKDIMAIVASSLSIVNSAVGIFK